MPGLSGLTQLLSTSLPHVEPLPGSAVSEPVHLPSPLTSLPKAASLSCLDLLPSPSPLPGGPLLYIEASEHVHPPPPLTLLLEHASPSFPGEAVGIGDDELVPLPTRTHALLPGALPLELLLPPVGLLPVASRTLSVSS